LSGAVLDTFQEFFGTDKVAFDVHSGRFPGQPRHFDRFSQALKEIIDARVWGGDPLPHRRRPGNGDRQEGRQLAGEELLPAGDVVGRASGGRGTPAPPARPRATLGALLWQRPSHEYAVAALPMGTPWPS
jgi:hypothetical protein